MSSLLDSALDLFLVHTELHAHRYGVPHAGSSSGYASRSELFAQESKYFDSYTNLTERLNRLMYLNELSKLRKTSPDAINAQYEQLLKDVPFVGKPAALEIKKYLFIQNSFVKTQALLNNYLQISLPILRSIHHASSITSTETSISLNLAVLFSSLNANLDANINKVKNAYELNLNKTNELNSLNSEFSSILQMLAPKINRINEINVQVNELNEVLLSNKRKQILEINFNTKSVSQKYSSLAEKWGHINILCDFLPSFVLCLPTNWYDDKVLFQIIEDCNKISQSYQDAYNNKELDFNDLILKLDQA